MATELGSWVINYIPEDGGRFTGQLSVTDEKVRFVSLYESSNRTIVTAIFASVTVFTASGGHLVYRYYNDKEAVVELPAAEIASVRAEKKGLMKRAVLTMENGESFMFDYGLLPVTKLVQAVESLVSAVRE